MRHTSAVNSEFFDSFQQNDLFNYKKGISDYEMGLLDRPSSKSRKNVELTDTGRAQPVNKKAYNVLSY